MLILEKLQMVLIDSLFESYHAVCNFLVLEFQLVEDLGLGQSTTDPYQSSNLKLLLNYLL